MLGANRKERALSLAARDRKTPIYSPNPELNPLYAELPLPFDAI
jgi:hypothetical protein